MSKSKDVSKQILDYMKDQNRPFNGNDIFTNMRFDCGKAVFTRAMDYLVSENRIKEKSYGKQKVYFINQELFSESEKVPLTTLDENIKEVSSTLCELQSRIKKLEEKVETLNKTPTNEEAQANIDATLVHISEVKMEMDSIVKITTHIDPEEKKRLYADKERFVKEYKKRKYMANSIIDAILEGYPKGKKQLLEELGVDIDDSKL